MRCTHPLRRLRPAAPLILALLFAACTSTATITVNGGGSPTPSIPPRTTPPPTPPPTLTPLPAPPHALAWTQYDGTHTPQIWAPTNSGTPQQIPTLPPNSL